MREHEVEVVTAFILNANKADSAVSADLIHMILTSLAPDVMPIEPIEEVQVHRFGRPSEKGETKIIAASVETPSHTIVVPPPPPIPDQKRLARHDREFVEFDKKKSEIRSKPIGTIVSIGHSISGAGWIACQIISRSANSLARKNKTLPEQANFHPSPQTEDEIKN